jgi:hypothetical protein
MGVLLIVHPKAPYRPLRAAWSTVNSVPELGVIERLVYYLRDKTMIMFD